MLLRHCAILILLSCFSLSAQEANCESSFMHDTLSIPEKVPLMHGEALKVTLKNQSVVELFAEERKRFFVRLYVTENFYFNKIDVLQVESGKWTYPVKNCKQYKINKTTGMYVFEVQKNYLVTLRDEGITGLVFAGAKTDFTRSDGQQTRKMCRCFYETMFGKQ